MAEYRDPKVTTPTSASTTGGAGKWIAIVAAVIVAILAIMWLMGMLGSDDDITTAPVTITEEPSTAPITEPAPAPAAPAN